MIVDVAAGGALMSKNRYEAYEILEELASNDFQWQSEKETLQKVVGMHRLDSITEL